MEQLDVDTLKFLYEKSSEQPIDVFYQKINTVLSNQDLEKFSNSPFEAKNDPIYEQQTLSQEEQKIQTQSSKFEEIKQTKISDITPLNQTESQEVCQPIVYSPQLKNTYFQEQQIPINTLESRLNLNNYSLSTLNQPHYAYQVGYSGGLLKSMSPNNTFYSYNIGNYNQYLK